MVCGEGTRRTAAAYAAGVFSPADVRHAVGTLARLLDGLPDPAPGRPGMDGVLGARPDTRHPAPAHLVPAARLRRQRPPGGRRCRRAGALGTAHTAAVRGHGLRAAPRRGPHLVELGPGDLLVRLLPGCLPDGTVSAFALSRGRATLRVGPPGAGSGKVTPCGPRSGGSGRREGRPHRDGPRRVPVGTALTAPRPGRSGRDGPRICGRVRPRQPAAGPSRGPRGR